MRYLMAAVMVAAAIVPCAPAAAEPTPTEPAPAEPASCDSLGGSVQPGEICRISQSTDTFTMDIAFPVDYPDQQVLTEYVVQNRDGFVNVVRGSAKRDRPYQMEATNEQHSSEDPSRATRSVVLRFFEDLGGAHPSNWYKAFNYDLRSQKEITFDTLFAPNTDPLDKIFPIVQHEIQRQTGMGEEIPPAVGHDPSNYQNFAITDTFLIFYLAHTELLPPFAGPTQVRVPRKAIPPFAP
ncbi:esterase [Mycobacterium sp.]|uniref:esterase n=1 Tax=Mycobacterium sp. TaxID=1785 RepID=UPI003A8A039A